MIKTTPVHYHLGQFPPKGLDWPQLIPLIGPASVDGALRRPAIAIPNAHILLSPLTTQEAVLSSKIEGTHVTIGEVLEIEAGGESDTLTQPSATTPKRCLTIAKPCGPASGRWNTAHFPSRS